MLHLHCFARDGEGQLYLTINLLSTSLGTILRTHTYTARAVEILRTFDTLASGQACAAAGVISAHFLLLQCLPPPLAPSLLLMLTPRTVPPSKDMCMPCIYFVDASLCGGFVWHGSSSLSGGWT